MRRDFLKAIAALTASLGSRASYAAESEVAPLTGEEREFDLAQFRESFDPEATVLLESSPDLPEHWRGYLTKDHAARMRHFAAETAEIGRSFPKMAAAMRRQTRDAFVISYRHEKYGQRVARILNKLDFGGEPGGAHYSYVSEAPIQAALDEPKSKAFLERAPAELADHYRARFDGLWAVHGGGLASLYTMQTLASPGGGYADQPWFDAYVADKDVSLVFELCYNGVFAVLIDLTRPASEAAGRPIALVASIKEGEWEERQWHTALDETMSVMISGE